jgi:hypothetical protein
MKMTAGKLTERGPICGLAAAILLPPRRRPRNPAAADGAGAVEKRLTD